MAFRFWGSLFVYGIVNTVWVTSQTSDTFGKVELTHCNVVGTRDVSVEWKPIARHLNTDDQPINYTLFYCKSQCSNISVHYKPGCTITDRGFGLRCNLGDLLQLDFPCNECPFYYYIKTVNSNGSLTSDSKIFSCNFNMEMKCTVPTDLKVKPTAKRTLQVTWNSPPYMGTLYKSLLCYRISYQSEGNIDDKTEKPLKEGKISETLTKLRPYSKYEVYVACAVTCSKDDSKWGQAAGPAISWTLEEAPSMAPKFQQYLDIKTYGTRRNILVTWELPLRTFWNGRIRSFIIDYWVELPRNVSRNETDSQLAWKQLINDSSARQASLKDLNQSSEYKAQIKMCTGGGCSEPSPAFKIKLASSYPQNLGASGSEESDRPWLTPVIASITVVIVAMIVIMIICFKRRRTSRMESNEEGTLMDRVGPVEPYRERYTQIDDPLPESDYEQSFVRSCDTLPENQSRDPGEIPFTVIDTNNIEILQLENRHLVSRTSEV